MNISTPPGWACAALAALLAGCAGFTPDQGFGPVDRLVRERTGHAASDQRDPSAQASARQRVAELLGRPLDADAAVEIALLRNPALQAAYAGVGIAEADRVRAGRLPNPSLRYGRLGPAGASEIDRAVVFDLLALIAMPVASQLEQQRLEQAQLAAADATVEVATRARKAFFQAVAARQMLAYQKQVTEAAGAAGELASRLAAAGNFSELAKLREQAFEAEMAAQGRRAEHQAFAANEQLVRALGLAPGSAFTLPERLPELPPAVPEPEQAEQAAIDRRLDVLQARLEAEVTARSLGLTKATRFVNVLTAGYQDKHTSTEPRREGYEVELELPLFDFGATRAVRAEATYRQAMNHAAAVANDARSQVREAWSAYRAAYDVARRYRDEVVPLRKRISEETLLRYNGMLVGPFELLADAREQVASVSAAVEALRDHWLAQTDLQAAMAGSR